MVEFIPVTWVLSAAIALNPRKWMKFVTAGVLGATSAAVTLTWIFHRWGLAWIVKYYPNLVTTSGWQSVELWVGKYGMFALAGLAASPLALTPGLAACGLMKMPLLSAGVGVLIGKSFKYILVGALAKRAARLGHNQKGNFRELSI